MDVQFLAFSGCPLADPARENLKKALAECDMSDFEEIDILDPASPEELRGWGSPTILVNGLDVTGLSKGNSVSCRVYPFQDGVPDVQSIVAGLQAVSVQSSQRSAGTLECSLQSYPGRGDEKCPIHEK